MFRRISRIKQILDLQDCIELLINEKRGVLAVIGDNDYPYAMPMNHYYDKESNSLYFHGGKYGHKIDSLRKNNKVSYCVYDKGYLKEDDWALNIKSVIVFGYIDFIEDKDEIVRISKLLSRKFDAPEEYVEDEINKALNATLCLKLNIEHISGKLVNEK